MEHEELIETIFRFPFLAQAYPVWLARGMSKLNYKLVEIVLYMAGMLMYHTNIFGKNNLDDLNKKIGELLAIMQDEE